MKKHNLKQLLHHQFGEVKAVLLFLFLLANLSSAAHSIYSASKAGIHMFTDAIREKLHASGNDHVQVNETNLEAITN